MNSKGIQPLWVLVAGYWLWMVWACSGEWSNNQDYNYGWFVPPLALYFWWKRTEGGKVGSGQLAVVGGQGEREDAAGSAEVASDKWRVTSSEAEGSKVGSGQSEKRHRAANWLAWAVVLGSLLLIFPIELVRQTPIHWRPILWSIGLTAFVSTLAVALLTGGRASLQTVLFPAAFMLLGIPWPTFVENAISFPLMQLVTQWSVGLIHLLGYPATAAGTTITLPNCTVGVEEACSGLRSLQTALMVGAAAGELGRLRTGARLALLLFAFVLALAGNQIRVLMLVMAGISGGNAAVSQIHDAAGYVVLAILLAGLGGAAWMMGKVCGLAADGRQQTEGSLRDPESPKDQETNRQKDKETKSQSEAEPQIGQRQTAPGETEGKLRDRGEEVGRWQYQLAGHDRPVSRTWLAVGRDESEEGRRKNGEGRTEGKKAAWVVLGVACAAMILAHGWFWWRATLAPAPRAAMLVPAASGDFQADNNVPAEILGVLGPDEYRYIRELRDGVAGKVAGYHFYWRPRRGNANQLYHRPDRCMPGAGWRIEGKVERQTIRLGDREFVFNVFPFRGPGGPALMLWGSFLNGEPVEIEFNNDVYLNTANLAQFIRTGTRTYSYEVAALIMPYEGARPTPAQIEAFANRVFTATQQ